MKAILSCRAPWARIWLLGIFAISADLGTALVAVAQVNQANVATIGALRGVSSAAYTAVTVAGYNAPSDGGGGFYTYNPADTVSADNGGTIILATDGARWVLTQAGPPSIKQFGAVYGNTGYDNAPAIQAALNASDVVTVPPGVYACGQPILMNDSNALIGLGSQGEATDTSPTNGAKFLFLSAPLISPGGLSPPTSGDACFVSDPCTSLINPTIENLSVYVDPSAGYHWMIHFTQPVAMDLVNFRGETTSIGTGGILCAKLPNNSGPGCVTCTGTSYTHHWYNVQITLPSYSGTGEPPSTTSRSLDVDFSDSEITGGAFIGGTGAHIHGTGGANYSHVTFAGSVGYNLTLEHDAAGVLQDGFVNCSFKTAYSGEIEVLLETYPSGNANVMPRFVGNVFSSPNLTSGLIRVSNLTGTTPKFGGVFMNNTFLSNPSGVYAIDNSGLGWTIAHNKYDTAPDFSGISAAAVDEDSSVSLPAAGFGGVKVMSASGGVGIAPLTGTPGHATPVTTMISTPIPANLMGKAGKLRISATLAMTASSGTKRVRITFGSPLVAYDYTVTDPMQTLLNVETEISMRGSAISQVAAHGLTDLGPGVSGQTLVTGATNTAAVQNVVLTGQLSNGADTLTLKQCTVELLQP